MRASVGMLPVQEIRLDRKCERLDQNPIENPGFEQVMWESFAKY